MNMKITLTFLLLICIGYSCHYSCSTCSGSEFYECLTCQTGRKQLLTGISTVACKCSENDDFNSCKEYDIKDNILYYGVMGLFCLSLLLTFIIYILRQQLTPFLITMDFIQFAGFLYLVNNLVGYALEHLNSLLLNFNTSAYLSRGKDRFFDNQIYDTFESSELSDIVKNYPKIGLTYYGTSLLHNAIYLYGYFILTLLIFAIILIIIRWKRKQETESKLHFYKGFPFLIFYVTLFEAVAYYIIQIFHMSATIDYILVGVTGAWFLVFLVLAVKFTFRGLKNSILPSSQSQNDNDAGNQVQEADYLFDNIKTQPLIRYRIFSLLEILTKVIVALVLVLLFKKVKIVLIILGSVELVLGIYTVLIKPYNSLHYNIIHTLSKFCQVIIALGHILIYQYSDEISSIHKIFTEILFYFIVFTSVLFCGFAIFFILKSKQVQQSKGKAIYTSKSESVILRKVGPQKNDNQHSSSKKGTSKNKSLSKKDKNKNVNSKQSLERDSKVELIQLEQNDPNENNEEKLAKEIKGEQINPENKEPNALIATTGVLSKKKSIREGKKNNPKGGNDEEEAVVLTKADNNNNQDKVVPNGLNVLQNQWQTTGQQDISRQGITSKQESQEQGKENPLLSQRAKSLAKNKQIDQLNDINFLVQNLDQNEEQEITSQEEQKQNLYQNDEKNKFQQENKYLYQTPSDILKGQQQQQLQVNQNPQKKKDEHNQKMQELWDTNHFENDIEQVQQNLNQVHANLQKIPSKQVLQNNILKESSSFEEKLKQIQGKNPNQNQDVPQNVVSFSDFKKYNGKKK